MSTPNLFQISVRDVEASTAFYRDLFRKEPSFVSPRYVAFEIADSMLFALWSGRPSTPCPPPRARARSG